MLNNNLVYIKKSPIHGWGLFSTSNFSQNDIITQSPGIIFGIGSYVPPELCEYTFPFPEGGLFLCLSYSNLINSSSNPNSIFEIDSLNKILTVRALRDIKPEEEITLRYME
jgi:SET domain-containing protein